MSGRLRARFSEIRKAGNARPKQVIEFGPRGGKITGTGKGGKKQYGGTETDQAPKKPEGDEKKKPSLAERAMRLPKDVARSVRNSLRPPSKAAKAVLSRIKHGAVHTAKEFPEAARGLRALASGKKPTKAEAEAIVSVGVTVSAIALGFASHGSAYAAAKLGKKMAAHSIAGAISQWASRAYVGQAGFHVGVEVAEVLEHLEHLPFFKAEGDAEEAPEGPPDVAPEDFDPAIAQFVEEMIWALDQAIAASTEDSSEDQPQMEKSMKPEYGGTGAAPKTPYGSDDAVLEYLGGTNNHNDGAKEVGHAYFSHEGANVMSEQPGETDLRFLGGGDCADQRKLEADAAQAGPANKKDPVPGFQSQRKIGSPHRAARRTMKSEAVYGDMLLIDLAKSDIETLAHVAKGDASTMATSGGNREFNAALKGLLEKAADTPILSDEGALNIAMRPSNDDFFGDR